MKHFSMSIILGVLLLIGCADKKETAPEQNDTSPSQTAAAKSQVSHDNQQVNTNAPLNPKQNSNDSKAPNEVESAPKFAAVTDHLVLKDGESWSWQTLASMPKIQEWQQKTPARNEYDPSDPTYYIGASLSDYGGISAYGDESQPHLIDIGSAQGVMDDEEGKEVYRLEDLFRANELTQIKSNCETSPDDLISQQFYKWQKERFQTLYLVAIVDQANAGTSSSFKIAKDINEFFEPVYKNSRLGVHTYDQEGNDIDCTFEL